jgi:hypothetical protein
VAPAAPTLTPLASSNLYGSHRSPVATSLPANGTTSPARSLPGSSCSTMTGDSNQHIAACPLNCKNSHRSSVNRQMSMLKPVCPNVATATPLGPRGPRRRRSSTPGCSSWTRNHPPPESVFPRARHGRSLPRCGACIPDIYAASGPNREPGRILIPGDGAAGDQGTQNRPACPAMTATRHLRAVPSQRPPGAMVSDAHAVL